MPRVIYFFKEIFTILSVSAQISNLNEILLSNISLHVEESFTVVA